MQSREQKSVPSQQPVLNRPNYAANAPSRCRLSIPLGATSQKYRVSTLSGPTSRLQPDSMKLSTLPPRRLRPGPGRVMQPRPSKYTAGTAVKQRRNSTRKILGHNSHNWAKTHAYPFLTAPGLEPGTPGRSPLVQAPRAKQIDSKQANATPEQR